MNKNQHGQGDGRARKNKIQSLIIKHLREQGTLDILLPDGITLEIGITQIGKDNKPVKCDDYCSINASRENRRASLDSYNMGLSFKEEDNTIVFQESFYNNKGDSFRGIEVI